MAKFEIKTDWHVLLLGEALVFESLGRLLYEELDKAWLQSLLKEDVFEDVPFGAEQHETKLGLELLQNWARENEAGISDKSFDDLRVDYTRLFVGIKKVLAPLWESVYFNQDRMVFQEQTLQVRAWYRRFGLEPEKLYKEPDDHIGLELLFLVHLAKLGLQALEENDQAGSEKYLQAQRDFLSEHLLRWGPAWAKLVRQHASTDFYRGLAHLVHGTLLAVAELLEVEVPKEKMN